MKELFKLYPWINFHINVFSHTTLNDVDPINSLTLENVSSVANTESES